MYSNPRSHSKMGIPVVTVDGLATTAAALGKIISGLIDLSDPWEKADPNLQNLITRLAALKITLGRIRERLENDSAEHSPQLLKDLGVSMTYCILLVSKVGAEISEGQARHTVDGKRCIIMNRIAFGKSQMDPMRKIQRLTHAFDLLFTACNWYVHTNPSLLCVDSVF